MKLGPFSTFSAGNKNGLQVYNKPNYVSKYSLYHKQRGITKLNQAKNSTFTERQ